MSLPRQPDGRRAGDDGLAHAALAGKEDGPGPPVRNERRLQRASSSRAVVRRVAAYPNTGRAAARRRGAGRERARARCPGPRRRGAGPAGSASAARRRYPQMSILHRDPRREEGPRRLVRGQDPVDDQLRRDDAEPAEFGARASSRRSPSPPAGGRTRTGSAPSRSAPRARSYFAFASAIAAAGPMHVWPEPASASEMLFVQASGSSSRRTVWPVGAVSKMTRSKASPPAGRCEDSGIQEVGEAVECRDLGGARPGELLLHDPHDLGREDLADRGQRAVGVLGGRLVGVDLHRPQVRHPDDRGDGVADRLFEHSARFDAGPSSR